MTFSWGLLLLLLAQVTLTSTTKLKLVNFPKEYYTKTSSTPFKITDVFVDFDDKEVVLKFILDTNFMTSNYGMHITSLYKELYFSQRGDSSPFKNYRSTQYSCVFSLTNSARKLKTKVFRTANENKNLQRAGSRAYEAMVFMCKIPKAIQKKK